LIKFVALVVVVKNGRVDCRITYVSHRWRFKLAEVGQMELLSRTASAESGESEQEAIDSSRPSIHAGCGSYHFNAIAEARRLVKSMLFSHNFWEFCTLNAFGAVHMFGGLAISLALYSSMVQETNTMQRSGVPIFPEGPI
jgi:hypothetical protein